MALFAKISLELDFPKEEREILRFWKSARIFEKTLAKPVTRGRFVFYEGPPTANGMPHNGHVLTRVVKDLFPRYKTMRGWTVPRKAGWDTHGLPVEVEVEKELRIHGKAAIERYGVEPFVKRCIESVFRYTKEWAELTERVAFWVDIDDAYVTYHRSYVESVWWALSQLFEKGLLYQGHKVVWWWAQGGTALSSGEVGQGYRTVDDPSVYVAFPVVGSLAGQPVVESDVALLVWTTTPWTLPSNMYAAVHPDLDYVLVRNEQGKHFVLAEGLLATLATKLGELAVERRMKGTSLVGTRYLPPFDLFIEQARGWEDVVWRVVAAPFVSLAAGTGIVHLAPAFGEDDHEAHRQLARGRPNLPLFCAVEPDGSFVACFERYAGRWVKDCDKEIQHDLEDSGRLVLAELYRHDYPFCWRADRDPLIQYARPAWYIRTTAVIDRAITNNRAIHWLPEHIKEGRFGDFLANNVDWALSRERWWGTPLNVWLCDANADHKAAPASIAAIESLNPNAFDHFHAARRADPSLSEHLLVHKPWIDQVTFPCAACAGTMRRVAEVIDCWFDSGCMPFAQWGYPHRGREAFEASFPADFISEAIDQTRGWFYSLLMISTLVFDREPPHPFKTCIVLGHVTDKDGKKESKSKGNYTPPEIILDKVAMEFAVVEEALVRATPRGHSAAKFHVHRGQVLVAPEDIDGLDLQSGAVVRVYRKDAPATSQAMTLAASKGLRRRQVVMHADDLAALGLLPASSLDVMPAEVPRLPREQRVVLEDPSTTAPGADAFRWFFYASSPPWSTTRYSLSNVRTLQREFAVKLRNVYSFFTIYAGIDDFRPAVVATPSEVQPELDRWLRGELALTTRDVTARLDQYDIFAATQRLVTFVDALSNWWVRRSRTRFWKPGWDGDKRSAYETLYACLVTLSKLTAPFTPFGAEAMYQNLVVGAGVHGRRESVHLEDWPEADLAAIDDRLSRKIEVIREIVSLGLRARMDAKIKVRQPLRCATLVLNDHRDADLVANAFEDIREELNVLDVTLGSVDDRRAFGRTSYKPNFRSFGQRGLGKLAQELKKSWADPSAEELAVIERAIATGKAMHGDVPIFRDDIETAFEPAIGFAAAADRVGSVFLDTQLDDPLRELGFVRELVSRVQTTRKEMSLEFTDRIRLFVRASERVGEIVTAHSAHVANEVLAVDILTSPPVGDAVWREVEIDGQAIAIGIQRAARQA
ncbi:MAG: isoleucine--tRNA ligase [Myxococcota bacterium]|nr:isoleucine--tRNA ligase [Myxococcota bacterium]